MLLLYNYSTHSSLSIAKRALFEPVLEDSRKEHADLMTERSRAFNVYKVWQTGEQLLHRYTRARFRAAASQTSTKLLAQFLNFLYQTVKNAVAVTQYK